MVKFFCKTYPSLRVILKSSETNAQTGRVTQGITAEFIGGLFRTKDHETIKLMHSSKYFGVEFDEVKE